MSCFRTFWCKNMTSVKWQSCKDVEQQKQEAFIFGIYDKLQPGKQSIGVFVCRQVRKLEKNSITSYETCMNYTYILILKGLFGVGSIVMGFTLLGFLGFSTGLRSAMLSWGLFRPCQNKTHRQTPFKKIWTNNTNVSAQLLPVPLVKHAGRMCAYNCTQPESTEWQVDVWKRQTVISRKSGCRAGWTSLPVSTAVLNLC